MAPRHPGILLANTSSNAIGDGSDVTVPIPSGVTSSQQHHQQQQQQLLPGLLSASSVSSASALTTATTQEAIIGISSEPTSLSSSGSRALALAAATTALPPSATGGAGVNKSVPSLVTATLTPPTPALTALPKMSTATAVVTPAATASNNNNNNTNSSQTVKSCAGCGARIVDRFLLHAMDRYWHTGCLKCSCCQAQLGEIGTSCFTKAGMILCKNDYIRLFGSSGTCAACSQNIPAQEFVMRAQTSVYHVNCFTCVTCHQRLVPGDRYSIFNGSLICEQDYPKVLKGHTTIPMRPSHKVNNNNTNINNRNEADMLPYY